MTDSLSTQRNVILQRLSHEFRTPLAVIQNSVDHLYKHEDHLSRDQRQERLLNITQEVDWLNVVLEDILRLLRLDEEASLALTKTTMLPRDLVQIVLLELERYRLDTSMIEVNIRSEREVFSARDALVSIMVHLLSNAIKFSRKSVALEVAVIDSALLITVTDQGIGIPVNEQKLIFEPLVRGSNLDEVGGIGLGLAIVAGLVEQLRGSISVSSMVGRGTTVTVRIPV